MLVTISSAIGILLGATCLLCAGCASVTAPKAPQSAMEKAGLRTMESMTLAPHAPVSSQEAASIAREYFHVFFGNCGGIDAAKERGDYWAFPTFVGYGATKGTDILVAKSGTCVFAQGDAAMFWIEGHWKYDRTKYPTFFDRAGL